MTSVDWFLWSGSRLSTLCSLWNSSHCNAACRYRRPAGDSGSKPPDWLFPMSEISSAAGCCYRLNVYSISCSKSSPLLFPQGDYRVGQMASRMHLLPAVAPAHSSPPHTPCTPKHCPIQNNSGTLRMKRHNWKLSGDTDQSLGIGLTAGGGYTHFMLISHY